MSLAMVERFHVVSVVQAASRMSGVWLFEAEDQAGQWVLLRYNYDEGRAILAELRGQGPVAVELDAWHVLS